MKNKKLLDKVSGGGSMDSVVNAAKTVISGVNKLETKEINEKNADANMRVLNWQIKNLGYSIGRKK